jgi:CheY-like chemotaxis protein
VVDLEMPHWLVFELLRRLRENPATEHLPVVVGRGADVDAIDRSVPRRGYRC